MEAPQILSDEDQDDIERTPEVVDLNEVTENNDTNTTIQSKKTEKNLVDNSMKHY